jgi:hypothetical protein
LCALLHLFVLRHCCVCDACQHAESSLRVVPRFLPSAQTMLSRTWLLCAAVALVALTAPLAVDALSCNNYCLGVCGANNAPCYNQCFSACGTGCNGTSNSDCFTWNPSTSNFTCVSACALGRIDLSSSDTHRTGLHLLRHILQQPVCRQRQRML